MIGPGGPGLIGRTGPIRAPGTTAARPGPELQPTKGWLFDSGPKPAPEAAAPAGVTVTAPTSVGLSGNAGSVTTPSFTPTANSKLIVIAAAYNNSHTAAKSWTISGGGLGWTATATSAELETAFGANFDFQSTIWWADVGSSPASMTVTADPYTTADLGFISVIVFEVIGLATGGSFVVQSAVTNVTTGGSNTTALAAAPTTGNPVLAGWFSIAAGPSTWNSPASGWTSLTSAAGDLISPNGLVSTTDADGSLAHGYTGTPVSCAGVLIEIGTPGPAATATRQPLVAQAGARRRRPTISTSRTPAPPAATPATATPHPLVVAGQVVRRRAEAIVTRAPQAPAAAPPAATPDAVVVGRPPRRRLATIILGRARPTAPGTDPLIVSRRPRRPGSRIVLVRAPGRQPPFNTLVVMGGTTASATVTTPAFDPPPDSRLVVVARVMQNNHATIPSWSATDSGGLGTWVVDATGPLEASGSNFARQIAVLSIATGSSPPTGITITVDAFTTPDTGTYAIAVLAVPNPTAGWLARSGFGYTAVSSSTTAALGSASSLVDAAVFFAENSSGNLITWQTPPVGWSDEGQSVTTYVSTIVLSATADLDGSVTQSYIGDSAENTMGVVLEVAAAGAPAAGSVRPVIVSSRRARRTARPTVLAGRATTIAPTTTPGTDPLIVSRRPTGRPRALVVARNADRVTPATATPHPLVVAGRAIRRRATVAITRTLAAPAAAPATATPQPTIVTKRPRGRALSPQLLRSPARASATPRPLIMSRRPGPRFRLPIITRARQAPATTPGTDPLIVSRRPATRTRRPIIGANPAKGPFFPKTKGPVVVTRNPVGRFRAFIRLATGRRSTFTPSIDVPHVACAATRHSAIARSAHDAEAHTGHHAHTSPLEHDAEAVTPHHATSRRIPQC